MQSLTPQTPIRSWAVMSRLDGGQRWEIEHAKNASVTTLAELAAWGRPKQGQWSGFGKTKIAAWTAILAEAGLEWRGMAPVYPRGNPMYANITPMTEEPEDVVYRLQVAIDNDWLGRFPMPARNMIPEAIREIRGLRSGQDVLMDEMKQDRQAMALARETIERLRAELAAAKKRIEELEHPIRNPLSSALQLEEALRHEKKEGGGA